MKVRVLALLLALLAGCAVNAADSAQVGLAEFSVDVDNPRFRAGEVSIHVRNQGQFPHTLVVTTEGGEVVATTGVLAPAETTGLVLDLAPGVYQFTCRIVVQTPDGTVVDHYQEGMRATVLVEGD